MGACKIGHSGIKLVIIALVAVFAATVFPSCSRSGNGQESVEDIADRIWNLSRFRPDGFTVDVRTMEMPVAGIAVAYAATQGCHSREGLEGVVRHALDNDGYVGGWYDSESGLYYFDSTRLFPEDRLEEAMQFARDNGQLAVYDLSTGEEIRVDSEKRAAA